MLDLEESMLLGLRQHDDDPEADDTRFAAQAGSLDNEDCFDLDPDAIPTQNYSPDQPRDHGKWISDAAFGNVTHADIDSAGLPKDIEHRAHEALGRHERGEEIGRIAREAAESPQRPIPSGPSYEGKPAADAPKAREAAAEPLAGTHGEQLRELYSRAGQLRTTHDQIEQHVAMLKTLPKVDVVSAAREMGVEDHHLASKDRAIARVAKKLTDRLGHAERGAEIEAAARPTQNVFCPNGPGGGVDATCSTGSKFVGEKVGKAEHVRAAEIEQLVAKMIGGKYEDDNAAYDVIKGDDAVEVKSLLKGSKNSLSVHPDALLRKVGYAKETGATFHTVVVDDRGEYEGGNHAEKFSGNRIYYKRGSGRYSLSKMHPVESAAELRELIATPYRDLPEKAKGRLPKGDEVRALKEQAEATHRYRIKQNRKRRAEGKI